MAVVLPTGRVVTLERSSGRTKYHRESPEQGAATSVLLAVSPQLEGVGGRYFEDCNEAAVLEPGQEGGAEAGVAAYALDRGDADRLWELSLELIGRGRDAV